MYFQNWLVLSSRTKAFKTFPVVTAYFPTAGSFRAALHGCAFSETYTVKLSDGAGHWIPNFVTISTVPFHWLSLLPSSEIASSGGAIQVEQNQTKTISISSGCVPQKTSSEMQIRVKEFTKELWRSPWRH